MKWPWNRGSTSDKDVDVLLREANAAPASATSAEAPASGPFRMRVEDVFVIARRGTVATGTVESGSVRVGQQLRVVRDGAELGRTTVTGVEMFRKKVEVATAGDRVGLLVSGETGEGIVTGDVLDS